jgi:hypothetical protein
MKLARLLACGLAIAGVVGTTLADPPKPAPKKTETFAGPKAKKAPVIITAPPADVLAEAIKAEMDAYTRRLDACTRLRQIAIETGDETLLQTADDLERQCSALYQQRVARLGIKGPAAGEGSIEARLGGTVDPLKVAAPSPAGTTPRASR